MKLPTSYLCIFGFKASTRLSFSDISTEIAIRARMCPHHSPLHFPSRVSFQAISVTCGIVGFYCDGHAVVVNFHIRIPTREADAQGRRCTVKPFAVAST